VTLQSMTEQIQGTLLRERLMAALSAGFAALAVVLAAVGLYGLMAYGVARRRNEIGVRVALGATRGRVVLMIVRETAILVAAGVAAGIGLAVWSGRAAAALLYGLTASDPRVLALGGPGVSPWARSDADTARTASGAAPKRCANCAGVT